MIWALVAAALWLAIAWALLAWARRGLDQPDEIREITTSDGWTLPLRRFRPRGEPRPVPIVMAHGFMMDWSCFVLSRRGSLPRALADRGHDVWLLNWRGGPGTKAPPGGRRWSWRFEDHAEHDAPAVIDAVCAATGKDRVTWIGHSMGGMILYRHASQRGSARLHRVVTLGSPARLAIPRAFRAFEGLFEPGTRCLSRLPARVPLRLVLPLAALFPRIAMRLNGNPDNLTLREVLALLSMSFQDTSGPLLRWFADHSLRQAPIVDEELRNLRAPLLVLAGGRDRLAPPEAARLAWEVAGSSPRAYFAFGDSRDGPGHADLCSGQRFLPNVMAAIIGWIEPETPSAPPGAEIAGSR